MHKFRNAGPFIRSDTGTIAHFLRRFSGYHRYMNYVTPPFAAPDREHSVTASELVRQFGVWQNRAMRAPVYIFNRGHPRFVLAAVELIEELCAPYREAQDGTHLAPLLDALPEIVVLLDDKHCITATSAAARSYFGAGARIGNPVEAIEASIARGFLEAAVRRVAATGLIDTIELPSPSYLGRALAVMIAPQPFGIALIARDATVADELRIAEAEALALDDALGAARGIADVRINLRGYLERPSPALVHLTALTREALASVRFVTLLDISSRVAAGNAIEAVIADGTPRAVSADLLVNREAPVPIRIGFAALRIGPAVEAVRALIATETRAG